MLLTKSKKHSKSRAQLSAVTACSHKAARVLSRRHTCYTSVHSSRTGEKCSLQPRPPQTQRTREVSSKRGKPGAKRAFSCREACISVQGMGPACSTCGLQEPAQISSKIQPGTAKSSPCTNQEEKSWDKSAALASMNSPCTDLLGKEVGSCTYRQTSEN